MCDVRVFFLSSKEVSITVQVACSSSTDRAEHGSWLRGKSSPCSHGHVANLNHMHIASDTLMSHCTHMHVLTTAQITVVQRAAEEEVVGKCRIRVAGACGRERAAAHLAEGGDGGGVHGVQQPVLVHPQGPRHHPHPRGQPPAGVLRTGPRLA